jgi:hypothetical protein
MFRTSIERAVRDDPSSVVCELFCTHLTSLFYLAHLISGSTERAGRIVLRAVDLTIANLPMNREYGYLMARRCVIKSSIEDLAIEIKNCASAEMKEMMTGVAQPIPELWPCDVKSSSDSLVSILRKITVFRRIVVILRVFERYHSTDTALLLGQAPLLVSRALEKGLEDLCRSIPRSASTEHTE